MGSMAAAWQTKEGSISSASWRAGRAAWNVGKLGLFGVGGCAGASVSEVSIRCGLRGRWPVRLATTSGASKATMLAIGPQRRARASSRQHPQTPSRRQPQHRSDCGRPRRGYRRNYICPGYGGAAAYVLWCHIRHLRLCQRIRVVRVSASDIARRHRDQALPKLSRGVGAHQ